MSEPTRAEQVAERSLSPSELRYLERFRMGDMVLGSREWERARSKWERAVYDALPQLVAAADQLQAALERQAAAEAAITERRDYYRNRARECERKGDPEGVLTFASCAAVLSEALALLAARPDERSSSE